MVLDAIFVYLHHRISVVSKWLKEKKKKNPVKLLVPCSTLVNLLCFELSHFSRVWLCATLWAATHQAPLSMGFSRQEYWSGLPCPPSGDLPNSGTEPWSPGSEFFTVWDMRTQNILFLFSNRKWKSWDISIMSNAYDISSQLSYSLVNWNWW